MPAEAPDPPPVRLALARTVRLVATARLRDPVLLGLVGPDRLADLAAIEAATSGRLAAERHGGPELAARELVFGVAQATFINAAFAYWRPREANRFNGPGRGAWYAALARQTAIAEVAFHLTRELTRIGDYHAIVDYAELFAGFAGDFADLRGITPPPACLDPDPAVGYPLGNAYAERVRAAGWNGIVYPSVRDRGGTCLVALIPHAVQSVTQGDVLRLVWSGSPEPRLTTP